MVRAGGDRRGPSGGDAVSSPVIRLLRDVRLSDVRQVGGKAAEGTIRKLHAKSIGENSVHGSDAPETAAVEIAQFFSGNEIVG